LQRHLGKRGRRVETCGRPLLAEKIEPVICSELRRTKNSPQFFYGRSSFRCNLPSGALGNCFHGIGDRGAFRGESGFFRRTSSGGVVGGVEAIADPWLGVNVGWFCRVELYFLPQLIDHHAQRFRLFATVRPPHGLQ